MPRQLSPWVVCSDNEGSGKGSETGAFFPGVAKLWEARPSFLPLPNIAIQYVKQRFSQGCSAKTLHMRCSDLAATNSSLTSIQ